MDNELLYCGIENRTPCSYSSLYLSIFLSFTAKFVSQFSLELCMLESSNMVYICRMSECIVGLRLRVMAFILLFLSIFLFFPILHVNIKKFQVGVFSGTFKARMLKHSIHMDNEVVYYGIENQTPCSYFSLYLSIFLSFKAKYVSLFSPELCKLESSNMVYLCRMSDCILGLRLRVMALIFLFFLLSLYYMLTLKLYVGVFSEIFKARMLKLGIHMDNELYYGIENRTPCPYFSLYLSIFLSFKAKFVLQFSLKVCMLESSNMVYICRMSDYIVGWKLRVMALIFLF